MFAVFAAAYALIALELIFVALVLIVANVVLIVANVVFASSYRLWQMKAGYKKTLKHTVFDVFCIFDNIGNATYSLGNDLNAFGGRYFNAAPIFNYTAGLNLSF